MKQSGISNCSRCCRRLLLHFPSFIIKFHVVKMRSSRKPTERERKELKHCCSAEFFFSEVGAAETMEPFLFRLESCQGLATPRRRSQIYQGIPRQKSFPSKKSFPYFPPQEVEGTPGSSYFLHAISFLLCLLSAVVFWWDISFLIAFIYQPYLLQHDVVFRSLSENGKGRRRRRNTGDTFRKIPAI